MDPEKVRFSKLSEEELKKNSDSERNITQNDYLNQDPIP